MNVEALFNCTIVVFVSLHGFCLCIKDPDGTMTRIYSFLLNRAKAGRDTNFKKQKF